MKWRVIGLVGIAAVLVTAVLGVRAWNERPPAPAQGLVRLTLPRMSSLPPLRHAYPGGEVSLNAVLSDDEVFIGFNHPGREVRVRKGQTIEVPGGTLTLVEVWNVMQPAYDAVDVSIVQKS